MEEFTMVWIAGGFFVALVSWRYLLNYLGLRGFVGKVDRELDSIITRDEYKVKGKFE